MTLHLDWVDYAERLLGPADWTDAASVAALLGKAQALLPSDIVALPVARVAGAHVAASASLRSAMAAKPASAQPLRAVLADAPLRAMLTESLARLAGGVGLAALALDLPAPAELAAVLATAAGLAAPMADEDLADDAAVYVADFLRAFAAAPMTVLLLGAGGLAGFEAPILRVAGHYGWQVIRPGAITSFAIPAATPPEAALRLVADLRVD